MLIQAEEVGCVCLMTFALDETQPKISRHLALMREAGIVTNRREGTWIHYRIDPSLPSWAKESLKPLFQHLKPLKPFKDDRRRLARMSVRHGVTVKAKA